jgi:hypothetical protein
MRQNSSSVWKRKEEERKAPRSVEAAKKKAMLLVQMLLYLENDGLICSGPLSKLPSFPFLLHPLSKKVSFKGENK